MKGGEGNDESGATAGGDLFLFGLGDGQDLVRDLLHDHAYLYFRDIRDWGSATRR